MTNKGITAHLKLRPFETSGKPLTKFAFPRIITLDTAEPFAFVILRNQPFTKQRWVLDVVLCLLVFVFAFHAKTAVYGQNPAGKLSPSTSSKLWLDGQKLQAKPTLPPTLLIWITALLLQFFLIRRETFVRPDVPVVRSRHLGLQDLHRSLRPPPVQ